LRGSTGGATLIGPDAFDTDSGRDQNACVQSILLSTWSFGRRANAAAWPVLLSRGAADAVEAAGRDAEDDPANRTVGRGGYPDASGRVSLDALFMLAPDRFGAVACLRSTPHAITAARAVMERTPHHLLVGPDADDFARSLRLPEQDLLGEEARAAWEHWKATGEGPRRANIENRLSIPEPASHDTIGVLAMDAEGVLAGACTTSGLAFKLPGRVGDSPIAGHSMYVQPDVGAAVCTGKGELVMGVCGAFLAVECLRRGDDPTTATRAVIDRIVQTRALGEDDQVGVMVLRADGSWSGASIRAGFQIAVRTSSRDELVAPAFVLRR
jgi:isoaspartyl peptidase/L-asparaginase-like protein (Ntn-hydrolase superfamily)